MDMCMQNKLKQCPFCGGEAYTYTCHFRSRDGQIKDVWLVHCKKCKINYPSDLYKKCFTEQEAIDAWNTKV